MTVSTTAAAALPRWDVSGIFPGLDSPEFEEALGAARDDIDELARLFDELGIGGGAAPGAGNDTPQNLDEVLHRLNAALEAVWVVGAYVYAFVSTDSRDDAAQARLSELRQHEVLLTKLETRFTAWVGTFAVRDLVGSSEVARAHAFALERAHEEARRLMSRAEEELAADLDLTGALAWGKLHGDVTSRLAVRFAVGAREERELPMSEIRGLAHDAEREVRRRAYEAELDAWNRVAVPLAASMNSIKGQVKTLTARRGWASPLDEALFGNRIDRETLAALLAAVRESLPDLRRYLRAKARLLGVPALAWFDLFAPVGVASRNGRREWDFETARSFIVEQFRTYSSRLADFAARAFAERWIDAEPRLGKTDGAFCLFVRGDESRILANYTSAYSGVSTLAHELGHGYHNMARAGRTHLQRRTPMTLAETASIFCETIVRRAALAEASPVEQLEILEGSLQDSVQVTVDTMSRFLFESRLFDARAARELSIDELCGLMTGAQRETYGDGLDQSLLHPYMWAVKPHYYGSRSFYNFPYTFGLLFGLGLYALYEADTDAFAARYDDLLAATGSADVAQLASRFGIEVRTPDFWRSSLRVVKDDIERFERLAEAAGSPVG